MHFDPEAERYSAGEIARAAGVPPEWVERVVGRADASVTWHEALRIGRSLVSRIVVDRTPAARPLFAPLAAGQTYRAPFVVSSTMHATAVVAAVFVASLGLAPDAAVIPRAGAEPARLVFIATPGPGGGGGGGGRREPVAPPKARREGHRALSSPIPARKPPTTVEPASVPATPPPIKAEPLPQIVAPVITAPADTTDRAGVIEPSETQRDSRGPGTSAGTGAGAVTGIGSGEGAGIGPGSGGGTGGGPYRPGSGIEPPRLLREVKADYTDAARRGRVEGDVLLEVVVRRDGTVGDATLRRGLDRGLDERALQAVRQWRFVPAQRHGVPVDVTVEVSVEFRLR